MCAKLMAGEIPMAERKPKPTAAKKLEGDLGKKFSLKKGDELTRL